MYIQSLVIEGFKSFGRRTEINGFDRSFNAITGFNGSGKSNILDALCFVLGSKLQEVRAGSVTDLVYKNGQAQVRMASVSVTFDNRDEKYRPFGYDDCEQITITRQYFVESNKHKYFINDRLASRKNITDLLCSVHLNISNPHFIILQGRITKVLNMKPQELLSLIEETIGSQLYGVKRNFCLKALSVKDGKLKSVDNVLTEIKLKMERLEANSKSYCEAQKVEQDLKTAERLYHAYAFSSIEEDLKKFSDSLESLDNTIHQRQDNITDAKAEKERLLAMIEDAMMKQGEGVVQELKTYSEELQGYEREKMLLVSKLNSHLESIESEKKHLAHVEKCIKEEEKSLAVIETGSAFQTFINLQEEKASSAEAYATAQKKYEAVSAGLLSNDDGEAATIQEQLIAAQNMMTQTLSLQKQCEMELAHSESQLALKRNALSACVVPHDENEAKLAALDHSVAQLANTLKECDFEEDMLSKLLQELNTLNGEIRANRRSLEELKSRNPKLSFVYQKPEPNFDHSKVLGLVCRMFSIKDEVFTRALETAGGAKLWHVIVKDEKTAKALLLGGQLQRRVTCIPLNRIVSHPIDQTTFAMAKQLTGKSKAFPAIQLISFDPELRPAMEWVFGDVFVCLDSATARICAFDQRIHKRSVTLDGDVFDPVGILSGGAANQSAPALSALRELKEAELLLQTNLDKYERLQSKIQEASKSEKLFQLHCTKSHEAGLLRNRLNQREDKQLQKDINDITGNIERQTEQMKLFSEQIKKYRSKVEVLQHKAANSRSIYQDELKAAEQNMSTLKLKYAESCQNWSENEQEYLAMKMEIDSLKESLASSLEQASECKDNIEILKGKAIHVQDDINRVSEKIEQCSNKIKIEREKIAKDNEDVQRAENRASHIQKSIDDWELNLKEIIYAKKKLERDILRKEQERNQMLDQYAWIREDRHYFGAAGGMYDFKDLDVPNLENKIASLKKRHDKLHANIDGRFLQHLHEFKEKYQEILNLRKQINRDKVAIENTVAELDDLRKVEVQKAFEILNQHFGSIFSLLLPGAEAKLVTLDGKPVMDGVEIKVAFGGTWKEDLSELSGGQRSLAALSLIFSTLAFNPAPLYILDEVDAALDEGHTSNIGEVLKRHFLESQFIIVSLKEGMFENANAIFRTKFQDEVSSVSRISASNENRRSTLHSSGH